MICIFLQLRINCAWGQHINCKLSWIWMATATSSKANRHYILLVFIEIVLCPQEIRYQNKTSTFFSDLIYLKNRIREAIRSYNLIRIVVFLFNWQRFKRTPTAIVCSEKKSNWKRLSFFLCFFALNDETGRRYLLLIRVIVFLGMEKSFYFGYWGFDTFFREGNTSLLICFFHISNVI